LIVCLRNKLSVPPDVAEKRLQHLVAVTETHLGRYHEAVLEAQEGLLVQQGLDPDLLDRTPEQLRELLSMELEEAKLLER